MDLASVVKKYLEVAGDFDRSVHLSKLGLSRAESERVISAFDEDYQISRYLRLTREPDAALAAFPPDGRVYQINGYEVSHLSLHSDIQKLL